MKSRYLAASVGAAFGIFGAAWAGAGVELTTRVSGVVEEVLVKPGQQVKKGAVLLRLDATVLRARLDEAAAELARAEADAADARHDLERAQELFNRTVSSTSELDAAKVRDARAQAAVQAAKARQAIAQKNLADAALRAPFDAQVVAIPGQPGTVVAAECQPRPLLVLAPRKP
ncbi:MAG: efflux RND transporter periplasmic adaptor subunit [Thiobacillus sp.]|nr:efflux RND transporter periplasmic adaptor subunit [Thiobacillus sp.]